MPDLWEVFLSPHTDDETLAMAGAISRAHLAGLKTCVVLVTDNCPSTRLRRMYPAVENLADIRRQEFRQAITALGVDCVEMWEVSEQDMKRRPLDAARVIQERLAELHLALDIVHVHSVCGFDDIHMDAGFGCQAHGLCANVITQFAYDHPGIQASLHGVYVFSKHVDARQQCGGIRLRRDKLSALEWTAKLAALNCYYPSKTSLGYGYTSVPDLFDNVMGDPHEYVVEVTYNAHTLVTA